MKEDVYSKTALTVVALCLVIMTVQLYHSAPYKCDVCGWKVSPQAAICPRCGDPDPAHDAREREAKRLREEREGYTTEGTDDLPAANSTNGY